MDKYRETAEKRLKGMHPDEHARQALVQAEFASREREDFFNGAYSDIMVDLFIAWCNTEPHEAKSRESLYYAVVGLGHVKDRLSQYEMYGKNMHHMEDANG